MRLFFAAWPPAETAGALHTWAGGLEGRPVARENIHLTLAFLGEADPQRAIAAAKGARGARHALPLEEARFWPHNQIIWAGPRETPPPLAALVESLKLELYRHQFILERRPFAAHVTLLRKAKAPEALPALPALDWPVEELLLVRSRNSPQGPVYEPIERFPLSEDPP